MDFALVNASGKNISLQKTNRRRACASLLCNQNTGSQKANFCVWPKILIEFESLAMETLEFSIEVTIGKE